MPAIFKFDLQHFDWNIEIIIIQMKMSVIVERYPPFSFEFAFFSNIRTAGYCLILHMTFVAMIRTLL